MIRRSRQVVNHTVTEAVNANTATPRFIHTNEGAAGLVTLRAENPPKNGTVYVLNKTQLNQDFDLREFNYGNNDKILENAGVIASEQACKAVFSAGAWVGVSVKGNWVFTG